MSLYVSISCSKALDGEVYKNKFARLNSIDEVEVMKTKREKLEHFYKVNGLVGKVSDLRPETIKDITFMNNYLIKPAPHETCISLRNVMLIHLEKASPNQAKTIEEFLKHYECL